MFAGAIDVAALTAAAVSPALALIGTLYSVHRSGRAAERATAATSQVQAVEATHEALVGTIHELRAELARQDSDHAAAMDAVQKDIERFRKEVAQCQRERDQLRRSLAKLKQ